MFTVVNLEEAEKAAMRIKVSLILPRGCAGLMAYFILLHWIPSSPGFIIDLAPVAGYWADLPEPTFNLFLSCV